MFQEFVNMLVIIGKILSFIHQDEFVNHPNTYRRSIDLTGDPHSSETFLVSALGLQAVTFEDAQNPISSEH